MHITAPVWLHEEILHDDNEVISINEQKNEYYMIGKVSEACTSRKPAIVDNKTFLNQESSIQLIFEYI